MTTIRVTKRAWIRNADVPQGQPATGRISCACGGMPETEYKPETGNITCTCGITYTWDGWLIRERMPIVDWWETSNSQFAAWYNGRPIIKVTRVRGNYRIITSPSGWAMLQPDDTVDVDMEQGR